MDCVLSAKDNQPLLCTEVKEYFKDVEEAPEKYSRFRRQRHMTRDRAGSKQENIIFLRNLIGCFFEDGWTNLNTIGMMHSKVQIGDEVTEERRYFIPLLMNVKLFAKAACTHWSVENLRYWRL